VKGGKDVGDEESYQSLEFWQEPVKNDDANLNRLRAQMWREISPVLGRKKIPPV
jgi:hypothetical protein